MRSKSIAAAALLGVAVISTPAVAHPRHYHYHHAHHHAVSVRHHRSAKAQHHRSRSHAARFHRRHGPRLVQHEITHQQSALGQIGGFFRSVANDPRPSEWCSWWLRHYLGVAFGAVNNLALSWLHWGHPTTPHQGAVVVWNHGGGRGHVGIITGGKCGPSRYEITSGNTAGGRVATQCRSVGNAAGFREG